MTCKICNLTVAPFDPDKKDYEGGKAHAGCIKRRENAKASEVKPPKQMYFRFNTAQVVH